MPRPSEEYQRNVFINCPFDAEYKPLFEAIVFAVQMAGFKPRCALEASDAGQYRLKKIMDIIADCQYGVHDISRTELSSGGLPRFNMPLELGIDLGCGQFGVGLKKKKYLILDRDEDRYRQFISDISGQDVKAHNGNPKLAMRQVRDWLRSGSGDSSIPGGDYIHDRYGLFQQALPALSKTMKLDLAELPFVDFSYVILVWLEENDI